MTILTRRSLEHQHWSGSLIYHYFVWHALIISTYSCHRYKKKKIVTDSILLDPCSCVVLGDLLLFAVYFFFKMYIVKLPQKKKVMIKMRVKNIMMIGDE